MLAVVLLVAVALVSVGHARQSPDEELFQSVVSTDDSAAHRSFELMEEQAMPPPLRGGGMGRKMSSETYTSFPFLYVFEPVTMETCSAEFDQCLDALHAWPAAASTWGQYRQDHCLPMYCGCLPFGHMASNGRCSYQRPTVLNFCGVFEDCVPIMDNCARLFNREHLPVQCSAFTQCANRSDVAEDNVAACDLRRTRRSPGCDYEKACRGVRSKVHMRDPSASGFFTVMMISFILLCLQAHISRLRYQAIIREREEMDRNDPILNAIMMFQRRARAMGREQEMERIVRSYAMDDGTKDGGMDCAVCGAASSREFVVFLPTTCVLCAECFERAVMDALESERDKPSNAVAIAHDDGHEPRDPTSEQPVEEDAEEPQPDEHQELVSRRDTPSDQASDGTVDRRPDRRTAIEHAADPHDVVCPHCSATCECPVALSTLFVVTVADNATPYATPKHAGGPETNDEPCPPRPPFGSDYVCSICLEQPLSTVFLPCKHLAACEKCAERHTRTPGSAKTCHICREEVESTLVLSMAALRFAIGKAPPRGANCTQSAT